MCVDWSNRNKLKTYGPIPQNILQTAQPTSRILILIKKIHGKQSCIMPVQGVQIVQRRTTMSPLTTSLHDRKGRILPRIAVKGSQASYSVSF